MAFYFSAEDIDCPNIKKNSVQEWIQYVISEYSKEVGDITYIFTSDAYLLDINRKYLQHDYYTDIITFDYSESNIISGDLFISLETVKDNARKYQSSFLEELHRVIIHGIFHLLGFNDKSDEESKQMRLLENRALERVIC